MIYIEGVGYTDENTYTAQSNTGNKGDSNFDAILKQETVVYAKPAGTGATQEDTVAGNQTQTTPLNTSIGTVPAQMESYFEEAASTYGVDIRLLKAVAKQESNFHADSTSSAGAMGVMQLMPGTAKSLGVENPYDARENILGGAKYLSQLLSKYNNNLSLTLAAYNAGPGNVDKYGGIPPFSETKHYVNQVLAYAGQDLNIPSSGYSPVTANTGYGLRLGPQVTPYDHLPNQTFSDTDGNYVASLYAIASNDATAQGRVVSSIPASLSPQQKEDIQ